MDTRDVHWSIAPFAHKQVCVKLVVDLVSNRGYNTSSTHTSFDYNSRRYKNVGTPDFPLSSPPVVPITFADEQAYFREKRQYTNLWRRGWTRVGDRSGASGIRLARRVHDLESWLRDWSKYRPPYFRTVQRLPSPPLARVT